jgi:diguanylate cyclase (GGDEF)-like protein
MMKLRLIATSLLLLWVSLAILTSALPSHALGVNASLNQCRLDSWSVRDGLPPHPINAITQTPDGFLWLATGAGLIRFDGNAFTQYNSKNTPGLLGDSITGLSIDRDGKLWIGGEWTGFGRFENGAFSNLRPWSKGWYRISGLCQTQDGAIWAGGFGTGELYRLPTGGSTNSAQPNHALQIFPGFGDDIVQIVPVSNKSVVALGYNHGPVIAEADGRQRPYPNSGHIPMDSYTSACGTSEGDLWIGTSKSGLVRISRSKVRVYRMADGLPSNEIHCVYLDHNNRLWIGTNNGVCSWDKDRFVSFGITDGLPDPDIRSIFEDREGNLWVGMSTTLARFASTKLIPYSPRIGVNSVHVINYSSLAEDPASRPGSEVVWCATTSGLICIDRNSMSWVGGAFHQGFDGLSIGPDGTVWLSRNDRGGTLTFAVPIADIRRAILRRGEVPPDCTNQNALTRYPHVWDPQEFNVTFASRGYITACDDKGFLTIYPGRLGRRISADAGWGFSGAVDNRGTQWFASTNGLWQIRHGAIRHFPNLTPQTHFLGIDATDPSRVWLATDHGLASLSNGKFKRYTTKDGLPAKELFQVKEDHLGNLWLGYHAGICRVKVSTIDAYDRHNLSTIHCEEFGAADGIRDYPAEFTALTTSDGIIWFTGGKSITAIDSAHMPRNAVPPTVSIISSDVDGRPIARTRNSVPPGRGNFRAHFAALTFAAPERVRYAYRLIGLDDHWTYTADRDASFGNLPPGSYRFQVIACNDDGVWNSTGASLGFTIAPHYYQTLWFRLLAGILAIAAIAGLLRYRTARLMQRNRELEEKVSERTSELTQSNQELANANSRLADAYEELSASNQMLEETKAELEAQNGELLDTRETLAQANEQLELLARTDGLTDVYNRRAFREQLAIEWEQYQRILNPMSVVLLDVDKFKDYNDTYGHPAGDDVLRRVAAIISDNARASDFVARYGGEEFVVIAPNTGVDGAVQLAERIRFAIEAEQWPLRAVTASFGVSTATPVIESAQELVDASDAALYQSKKNGRNRVTHAGALENSAAQTRVEPGH